MEDIKSPQIKLEFFDTSNEPMKIDNKNIDLKKEVAEDDADKQETSLIQVKAEIKDEPDEKLDEDANLSCDNYYYIKCQPTENSTVVICDTCGPIIVDSGNLQEHLEASPVCMNNVKKLNENIQDDSVKKVVVHSQLRVQTTKTHFAKRKYSCNVCHKTFTQSSHLVDHKRIHTGEKPYSCDLCSKTFSKSTNLKQHINTHLGVRPFSCDVCGKKFATSSNLRVHKDVHLNL